MLFYKNKSDPPGILRFMLVPGFKFNTLWIADKHSKWHLVLSTLSAVVLSIWIPDRLAFLTVWIAGLFWEIGDGFKKGWWTLGARQASYLSQNLLYSDGFSWSDWIVYDLTGCILGWGIIFLLGTL